jgi:hypothetical protein
MACRCKWHPDSGGEGKPWLQGDCSPPGTFYRRLDVWRGVGPIDAVRGSRSWFDLFHLGHFRRS